MITILLHMTIKAERESAWRDLVGRLTRTTQAEDEGCLTYVFLRQVDDPRAYVLYEQWRDEDALRAHLARLQQLLGPPPTDEERLPAALLDFWERYEVSRYEPVDG